MAEVSSQTLHIVARELASELNEARASLEAFGEQQDNLALLRKCSEHLRSVHGALRVAEVYGAALLAEEMGQVARYLIDNFAEKRHLAEGLDALMRAMVQLPTYLERVLSGGRDMALVLLPLLNDLRAVRGHALLSEGTLLLLNLSSDQPANPLPAASGEAKLTVGQWARRLRTRFQLGLLGWIKGERVEQNLEILARAAEKLEQVATTQPVFQLWWVVGAVLEALREGGLESSASVKRLLGQADRDMKRLYELGEIRYCDSPALELLNNLLYYVARARSSGARVTAVRASFRLDELLPVDDQVEQARESLSAPSVKLMKTVAAAIKEDLGRVKDALDIFVRQGGTQVDELAPQLDLLKKIGDTLGVLGLGELRDKVQTETTELQAIVAQRSAAHEGTLLRMAATLIKVEDSLDEQLVGMIVPSATDSSVAAGAPPTPDDIEFRQVTEAVLRECIVNLARIKEAVAHCVEKPNEAQALDQIPQLMRGITAGLMMLGKTRAAEIIEGIQSALARFVSSAGMTLPAEAIDRLADAIVAVEYYMETLQAGRADPWYMLDNAEMCLRFLEQAEPISQTHAYAGPADHARTVVIESSAQTFALRTEHERTAVLDPASPAGRIAAAARAAQSASSEAALDRTASPWPGERRAANAGASSTSQTQTQVALGTPPSSAVSGHPTGPASAAHAASMPPVVSAPLDREIDPEFIELFIEEAKDEIARLRELFPRWDENPQDEDALVNVRRSFHTLKGSGRMVGAQRIGEFAWAIENLLNRVINKTLERTPDMMVLLREAVAAVPELVEQLETGRPTALDVARIIAQASELAGVRPAAPQGSGAQIPASHASSQAPGSPAPSTHTVSPPAPGSETIAAQTIAAEATPVAPAATVSSSEAPSMSSTTAEPEPPVLAPEAASVEEVERQAASTDAFPSSPEPDAHSELMDPALHEIYAKETAGHLAAIREYIAACERSTPPYVVGETLHRSCHTLSGTAKTAGARQGIKVAEPLNRYIRKLYDNSIGLPAAGLAVLRDAASAIQQVVDHIDENTGFFVHHADIIARLEELELALDAEIAHLAEAMDATSATPILEDDIGADMRGESAHEGAQELQSPPVAAAPASGAGSQSTDAPAQGTSDAQEANDTIEVVELEPTDANALDLLNWSYTYFPQPSPEAQSSAQGGIVVEEIEADSRADITADISPDVPEGIPDELPQARAGTASDAASDSARETGTQERASGASASGADHPPEDRDESPLGEDIVIETAAWAAEFEPPVLPEAVVEAADDAASESSASAAQAERRIEVSQAPAAAASLSGPAGVDELDEEFDPDIAAIFTEEATELLETADQSLSSWMRDRGNSALVFELKRAVHTLKGGARMASIRSMGDLSHELETLMQLVESGQVPAEQGVFDVLQASLDELHRMREIVSRGERCRPARALIGRIRALAGHEPSDEALQSQDAQEPAGQVAEPSPAAAVAEPAAADADAHTNIVPVLTEQFEHLSTDASGAAGHEGPDRVAAAGLELAKPEQGAIEQSSLEQPDAVQASVGQGAVGQGEPDAEPDTEIEMEFGADELGAAAPRATVRLEERAAQATPAATLDLAALPPELPPDPAEEAALETPAPALPGRERQAQERQEFARVDAELLDNLLNNAGEVSIFRSRMEQQISSIEFNLAELGRTVTRLKDQLRKLELETEAQILHRHQEEHPGRSDFDPLELDRYSTIQQLTRAFAESVSDVSSIEGLLENLTREAQNLLLQQSRVVTEMQNGLMRTRMVPFQRHVQRLTRLVRQVANETGKRAELVVTGASGELDRQVLERMLPPFEHMLRNSVVHGIETPQERSAAGKPASGTIKVGLHREGSEMVIVLEDDGRGIDVNAVRERARLRGLLHPGRVLSDEQALQLILEPGFSTASTVTQHAGRGVGMDVVVTEIKKLGGALFTQSQPGKGVKFTIRLPFTLAITQALIVRTGEELYALPLPSVEGVARVPRSEVQQHLAEDSPTFSYGGQVYRFQYLGAFIGGGPSLLPEADVSVPVILIRAGEHSTAIVTDELIGSREMVVKSVGPQIASIRGIAGATILGDGRIVIILDMGALVRSEWRGRGPLDAQGPAEDKRTFALVVDDSITVRRVTQRLLERNGMRVMTAKDGVDALSILQEHVPDVILLDIEMPRMDGYELASHVRADARLADVPIVMITSRVGEKHRARAIELGVNDYLGKPYQENQLLDAIEPLVEARRSKVS